ncbi:MAG: aspartate kinase [Waddliaceae bacterium]
METIVLKFGGAAVATPDQFSSISDIIIERKSKFSNVAVVVSAMGNTTDDLISLAKQVHPEPPTRELDMLISVGERISISLLAMALNKKSCQAVSFTGSQSGIITCNSHSNAKIVDVRPSRILDVMKNGKVAIVAGFQGMSLEREITTLGRGGSDTSAVALGIALDSSAVEFFKDVDGVFDSDPKINPHARQFPKLTYDEALVIVRNGARVLHERSILLAKQSGIPLRIHSFYQNGVGTEIGLSEQKDQNSKLYELNV